MPRMYGSVQRLAKETAVSLAIRALTGEYPDVVNTDTYTQINFTPGQVAILQGTLDEWSSKEPGDFRINYKPVLVPYYVKKFVPWAVGAALGLFLIGRLSK